MSYLFSKATSKLNKNEACCPSPPRMSMWKLLSNCRVKCRTIKCSLSSGLYLARVARLRQGREIAWCQSGSGENINAQQLAQAAQPCWCIAGEREIDSKSVPIFKKMSNLRHISWICTSCVQSLQIDFADQKILKIKLLMKCSQTFY